MGHGWCYGAGGGGCRGTQTPHKVSQNWVGDKVAVIMATIQQKKKKMLEKQTKTTQTLLNFNYETL